MIIKRLFKSKSTWCSFQYGSKLQYIYKFNIHSTVRNNTQCKMQLGANSDGIMYIYTLNWTWPGHDFKAYVQVKRTHVDCKILTQQENLHTRYSPTSTLALSREYSIRSKEHRKLLLCSYATIACNVFQNLVVRCTSGRHVSPMANKWCVPKLMVPKPNLYS